MTIASPGSIAAVLSRGAIVPLARSTELRLVAPGSPLWNEIVLDAGWVEALDDRNKVFSKGNH